MGLLIDRVLDLKKLRCKVCGRSWIPRSENPKVCPKCKSTRWNDESISGRFIRKKVKEEILEFLENGPMFSKQIARKLRYKHPIIPIILSEMGRVDKTIISNLEVSLMPTKTKKGRASRKYVLKEMQMKTPLLKLKKCDRCGGYGITKAIIADYHWADECLLCGNISNKVFDEKLKSDHDKWAKSVKEILEKIVKDPEAFWEKVLKNI